MQLNNYPNFIHRVEELKQNKLLFDFTFVELKFKCILFTEINTLLISNISKNKGCIKSISNNGFLNGSLPRDFLNSVIENIKDHTGKNKITPFWIELDKLFNEIDISKIEKIEDNEIISSFSTIKTRDKKYDRDWDKPFFKTWRRNNIKGVSEDNLNKTKNYFGYKIYQLCKQNKISSVWQDTPTLNSLSMLKIDEVEKEINEIIISK